MKKNNKKEKGAALINVMLIVLLAVAIGLPLLYLTVVNFMLRMFDNNLRAISYKNEMGMDNVYAIIQEIVIDETNNAKDRAKNDVDTEVKNEQDAYKAWTSDGRKVREEGVDGILGTADDEITDEDDLDKLKEYLYEYRVITQEEYDDENYEVAFEYLEIEDGAINTEVVKIKYNEYFKVYYKANMDTRNGAFDYKIQAKASSTPYNMRLDGLTNDNIEQFAIVTSNYSPYLPSNEFTSVNVKVDYRGLSEATKKYVNSEVSATFTIGVPEFDSASSINQTTVQISNPLLDKTLIIGKDINIIDSKALSIIGSTTVSGEGIEIGVPVINLGSKSEMSIEGRLAVNGQINLAGGTTAQPTYLYSNGEIYCSEIVTLGEHTYTDVDKMLYISDDMELNQPNTTMEVDTLIAFNDIQPNELELTEGEDIGKKSSAVLFNNASIKNLSFDVNNCYLFGNAFVGNTIYKTAESMAIKGNYRAYQIPLTTGNYTFGTYSGLSLVDNLNGVKMTNEDKATYFQNALGMNVFIPSTVNGINIENMKYSVGMWYDGRNWNSPTIGETESEQNINKAMGTNAAKDYEKYTKYFGYGEGNAYREIEEGKEPIVVGNKGWIDSSKLSAAADKYSTFNSADNVIVLVSEDDITLNDSINGKKGIIIAGGDLIINGTNDITFEGSIICGGNLEVNNNFKLINNSVAITKIIESAVTPDGKELFELFRDDKSGNLYTYSTIDTQIASINMNNLIKISEWHKSKYDI